MLSSEKTNRDVLKALKGWDRYIFHRKDAVGQGQTDKIPEEPAVADEGEVATAEVSRDPRPQQKVWLTTGVCMLVM